MINFILCIFTTKYKKTTVRHLKKAITLDMSINIHKKQEQNNKLNDIMRKYSGKSRI